MGVTADIGQDVIDIVRDVVDPDNSMAYDDWAEVFDWCYPHDHNTIVGICNICEPTVTDDDYRRAAMAWKEDNA